MVRLEAVGARPALVERLRERSGGDAVHRAQRGHLGDVAADAQRQRETVDVAGVRDIATDITRVDEHEGRLAAIPQPVAGGQPQL
nr:hypothetical protein [Sphaerisporangium perillae]